MELDDILSKESVLYCESVASKQDLLERLVKRAAADTGVAADRLLAAVEDRESLGSTGLGNGIAVPHGKVPGLKGVTAVFMRLGQPVDFDSIDEQPVDLVMMLLAPVGAGADHLKALARVARILRTDSVVEALRATTDPDRMRALLNTPTPSRNAA
jgi:PTS system nitrogen regulatory IIA component